MRKKRIKIGTYVEIALVDFVYLVVDILVKGLIFFGLWNYIMVSALDAQPVTLIQGMISGAFWFLIGSDITAPLKMKHFKDKK